MRIRLTMPSKDGKRLKEEILKNVEKVEEDEWSEEWELVSRYFNTHYFDKETTPLTYCLAFRLLSLTLARSGLSTNSYRKK